MIVAVCGLHGGSGTTTLATLLARAAARQAPGAVLLCEVSSAAGSLADAVDATSPYDLAGLADLVSRGRRPSETPWIDLADRLRILARPPRPPSPIPAEALRQVLADADTAHDLVVVDAGPLTSTTAAHVVLASATQVLWTVDSTAVTNRCRRLLAGHVCSSARGARWLLGVNATGRDGASLPSDQLASLHPSLVATVLVPRVGHLGEDDPSRDLSGMQLLNALR
jgi:hypothetical protein